MALGRIIEGRLTAAQSDKLVDDFLKGKIKRKRPLPVVRDVRLFFNTVNHAVETMRRSGIEARSEKNETEDYIEYRGAGSPSPPPAPSSSIPPEYKKTPRHRRGVFLTDAYPTLVFPSLPLLTRQM